jgi:protein O-GlcNAc transferase
MGDVSRAARHLERSVQLSDSINSWQSLATLIPALPEADHRRILETRRTFARKLATWTGTAWPVEDDRPPLRHRDDPLRIGYVSAFFHNANYTKPVWALINQHDRSAFQIYLFSDSPPDAAMPCYQPHPADEVHDVRALDNERLASLVRSCEIDVLVDLNAYSFECRLGLFLRHPAPVNVAWWAMYATSGLPGLDYLVGDDEMIKPGEEAFYTERLVRLPLSYLTFRVDYPVPPVVAPPCVERGYVTFGSLVAQYKVTPQVLDAWCEILRRAENARLLLANQALKSLQNRAYVLEQFQRRGVNPERLTLHGPADHFTYLKHYDGMDIALDAFPYNGGTTTIEAVWQGVPVLTFDGDRWVSRTSQTLLRRSHLGEFVARDVNDMVERAVHWASQPDTPQRLAALRGDMRQKLSVSAACDTAGLARAMEQFYNDATGRVT